MKYKKTAWKSISVLWPPLLIMIIACGMSLYYLQYNPEQILVFDDSYITLKFASHFFDYRGITYDGSSYLTGATSPLHILLIAFLGLFFKMEIASLAIGIIFFVFSTLIVYLWTLKIYTDKGIALLAGLMMATSGWLVYDSLNGLETTTFICFSLLTIYIYYCFPSKPLYIVPLFLSILTRPEGWFILSALWIWQIMQFVLQREKKILKNLLISICIFSLAIIPYMLLFLYCTGSLLPTTALSKAMFFAEAAFPLLTKFNSLKGGVFFFFKILLYPYPWFIFPLILFSRKVISLPYLWFYSIVFYSFYFFFFPGAISHYWCRYQHIFLPLIIIGIIGGTYELVKMCKGKALRFLVITCVVVIVAINQGMSYVNIKNMYAKSIASTQQPIINLARWLQQNTSKDALIALHDIGVVGYFSERRLLDLVGLVNPEISEYYWNKRLKIPLAFRERNVIDYLKEKKPDYLVMFPEWDTFLNVLSPINKKYFDLQYTSSPLYPTEMRYHVFKCNWGS